MTESSDIAQALAPVVAELDRQNVRYYVGGSVASSFHGAARSTLDVDLAAELDEATTKNLVASLKNAYYASESAALDAVRRGSCFNLLHLSTGVKVDIFITPGREFDRSVLDRAVSDEFGTITPPRTRIATAEDIILLKLEWYRLGNKISERQWNDVTLVAKLQGSRLDQQYLHLWAAKLGLTDLLEQLFSQLGSSRHRLQ